MMKFGWYWWVLALVPAVAGFVSLAVSEENFRSSGMVAGVGGTLGLLALLLLLRVRWRKEDGRRRWPAVAAALLLGLIGLVGLAEGLPEFLQARGLFVDLDSYGPRAVVANDGIFVVVGDDRDGGVVWRSDDGVGWVRVSELSAFDGLEVADAITVEGGFAAVAAPFNSGEAHVLTSADGWVWELTGRFENEDFGTSPNAIAVSRDGVVALTDIIGNDVEFFKSADLASWIATNPRPIFDSGEEGTDVACNQRLCVAVGKHMSEYRPDLDADSGVVWTTSGGDEWQLVHEDLDASLFNAATNSIGGFLIVGNDHDDRAIAWQSPDGHEWNPISTADFDGSTIDGAAALDSGYVIFGRDLTSNSILLWTSTDLEHWDLALAETTLPSGSQIRSIATSGGTQIAAGVDTTEGTSVVWTSKDGQSWVLSPLP